MRRILANFLANSLMWVLVASAAGLGAAPAVAADVPAQIPFDIPAQPVATALLRFSEQAGIQITAPGQTLQSVDTAGIRGNYAAAAALTLLLKGTGLTFRFVDDETIVIQQPTLSQATGQTGTDAVDRTSDSIRLAQATPEPAATPASREELQDIQEIIVTGTLIRGIRNDTAPLLVLDREAIEKTGYSTVQQLMESLPQNFGGGSSAASEDGTIGAGSSRFANISNATGVNLRGLGNTSTLVLINGRRMAATLFGAVVDTSVFPLSSIERIEVLTDGSSAVYGSDAVAGVVNIILKQDYEGAESKIRYGSAADSGTDERLLSQSVGQRWEGGSALLNLQYRERDALRAADRDFAAASPQPADLLPQTKQRSATFSAHHAFNDTIDVFADALYSNRDNRRRLALTSTTRNVWVTGVEDVSATLGVGIAPFGDWRIETAFGYGENHLEAFQDQLSPVNPTFPRTGENTFELGSVDLKADGAIFSMPGGAARLAVGGAYREEDLSLVAILPAPRQIREFSRTVKAAFAELYLPLIGASNGVPLVRRLELSAAGRYDEYSDFGDTTNPRFGVLWAPVDSFELRAAYSTSFRAPLPAEVQNSGGPPVVLARAFASPTGVGTVPVFQLAGGGVPLLPEESENYTFGFTFTPQFVYGLKLSFNYYDIEYTGRIQIPPSDLGALLLPNVYGPLITALPTDAESQAFLAAQLAAGAVFTNLIGPAVANGAGVRFIYDNRTRNLAVLEQSGFDVAMNYAFELGANGFSTGLNVGVINEIDSAFAATAPTSDLLDTFGSPIGLRARADFSWSRGAWRIHTAVNYTDSYIDTAPIVDAPVDSWTTVDLSVRYAPQFESAHLLRDLSVNLIATNLLNEEPPFALGLGALTYGFDSANADATGRFIAIEVRKTW